MKKVLSFSVFLLPFLLWGCNSTNDTIPSGQEESRSVQADGDAIAVGDVEVFVLDDDRSKMKWVGRKIVGEHSGVVGFGELAEIQMVGDRLVGGGFEIDMTSISTTDLEGDAKKNMDDHLKNEDFFAVDEFPRAFFVIKGGDVLGDNRYRIVGELMIKGISHEIEFEAEVVRMDDEVTAQASFLIDRTLWDIRYGSGKFFDDLGDKAIKDEMEFELDLVFAK